MAATKLNAAQQAKVLDEIAIRYLRGERQVDIAAVLELSQPQISYYLHKLQTAWRDRADQTMDAAQAEELARIDELERTYWQEWELSRQPGTRTLRSRQTKTVGLVGRKARALEKRLGIPSPAPAPNDDTAAPAPGGAPPLQVAETIRRSQRATITRLGNPAFLQGVQWCIQTRCAMLGITHLPPSEEPPRADAPTAIDAAAVAAAEAVLLDAYAKKCAALVPQLPADGGPPDAGGDPA